MVSFYLKLPFVFLQYWFIEAPRGFILFFSSLNNAFLNLFSLPLAIKTYFRPMKNEYRQGLVGFSIGIGIFIKTFVILADLLMFIVLLAIEFLVILSFIAWPFVTVWVLFI
jgi:hypothetical protein